MQNAQRNAHEMLTRPPHTNANTHAHTPTQILPLTTRCPSPTRQTTSQRCLICRNISSFHHRHRTDGQRGAIGCGRSGSGCHIRGLGEQRLVGHHIDEQRCGRRRQQQRGRRRRWIVCVQQQSHEQRRRRRCDDRQQQHGIGSIVNVSVASCFVRLSLH